MTIFYNIIIIFCVFYIFCKYITCFRDITILKPTNFIKLRCFIVENIYNFFSMKIFLLCTGLSVGGTFVVFQDQLGLLSLSLDTIGIFSNSIYWPKLEPEFYNVFSSGPKFYINFIKTIDFNMYSYFEKSLNKFYSVFLTGGFFFCSFFHSLAGIISLIYDYFLKRIFLKNNHILVMVILILIQSFLKIFFLLFLCFF